MYNALVMEVSNAVVHHPESLRRPVNNAPQNLGKFSSPLGPVLLMASPRFFDEYQRFGMSPFDVFCQGGSVTIEQHGTVDSSDLQAIMRHGHTLVPFEGIGSYFYSWQSRLAQGFPEFDGTVHVSQDNHHIRLTKYFPGVFLESTLKKIYDTEYRDEALLVEYQNNPLRGRASVTLKLDRAELKRWGDSIRHFESNVSELYSLLDIARRTKSSQDVQTENRSAVLQEIIYSLLSSDPEDRAAALACLKYAPLGIAEKAVSTYLNLGNEHSLDRCGYYDLSRNKSGLPNCVQHDFFNHIVLPLRTEAIRIAGHVGLTQHADTLFTLLYQCRYAIEHKGYEDYTDCFSKQRMAAAEALGSFARTDSAILERLIELADPSKVGPWWVKEAAILALGFSQTENPEAHSLIEQAAGGESEFIASIQLILGAAPSKDPFVRSQITAAGLLSAARLKLPSAMSLLSASLPNTESGSVQPLCASHLTLSAIKSLAVLGSPDANLALHQVFENPLNHWAERKEALTGLVELAPAEHKTIAALMAAYFQFKDPSKALELIPPLPDPQEEKEYVPWWNKLVGSIGDDLRHGAVGSLSIRASAAELFAKVPNPGLLRMISKFERESGRPEWAVVLPALDHLLKLDPKDGWAIREVMRLWESIDSYSWHATSYILANDLNPFASLFKRLELSHPELARNAIKPKAMLDSAFRDAVRYATLQRFSEPGQHCLF